jgi:hypothetical protein
VVNADLRRERGFRVAARQDRGDLPGGAEVGASDPSFVRLERLADRLTEFRKAREARSQAQVNGHVHLMIPY